MGGFKIKLHHSLLFAQTILPPSITVRAEYQTVEPRGQGDSLHTHLSKSERKREGEIEDHQTKRWREEYKCQESVKSL